MVPVPSILIFMTPWFVYQTLFRRFHDLSPQADTNSCDPVMAFEGCSLSAHSSVLRLRWQYRTFD